MFAAFSTVHSQNSFLLSGYSSLYLVSCEWIMLDFRDAVGERLFGENHLQICLGLTAAILHLTIMIAPGYLWLVSNPSFLAHSKQTNIKVMVQLITRLRCQEYSCLFDFRLR